MSSTFKDVIEHYSPQWLTEQLIKIDESHVEQTLRRAERQQSLTPEMFVALISPKAAPYLEEMASLSLRLTQQRFGKIIQLYVPLYLSNECLCDCTYCGFSRVNEIPRLTLNRAQILEESQCLYEQGFRHLLLLSGEDVRYVNAETLSETAQLLRERFPSISIEVQPLKIEEYAQLVNAGVDGLTIYQETYDRDRYSQVHLAGRKKHYDYRLATPERAGEAGVRKINIGALLGLSDWKYDGFCVALHAAFLEKKYWRSHFSISLPRMRKATGSDEGLVISDRNFVQLMIALRLFLPNAGIVLSTRESAEFRDHVFPLGVTQMSAGSKTTPGGYAKDNHSGAQFEIDDKRSVDEIVTMLRQKGYDPVWKDWDPNFVDQIAV